MNNYKLNDLYSLKDALQNGTLFKQLYKPYLKKVPQLVPENEEEKMLIALDQYSLALMDLNLYLDLNPTDKEMVNLYKDYLSKYKDLKKEFGEKFYSLTKDCEKIVTNNWNWELGKWPWERDK